MGKIAEKQRMKNLEAERKKIKSILNVRGMIYMTVDFSTDAIKERQINYIFKVPK